MKEFIYLKSYILYLSYRESQSLKYKENPTCWALFASKDKINWTLIRKVGNVVKEEDASPFKGELDGMNFDSRLKDREAYTNWGGDEGQKNHVAGQLDN